MRPLRFAPALCLLLLGAAPAYTFAQVTPTTVRLTWTAPGDDSLSGTAAQYDLRYSTSTITTVNFAGATRALGVPAPAASGATEAYTVTGLTPATTYYFALKTADDVGNWSGISNVVQRATPAAPDTVRPAPSAVAVTVITDTSATLGWTAVGDDSLTGTATSYEVRYSTAPITPVNFASATAVAGVPTPAAPGTPQSVVVRGLSRQVTYYFALRTSDEAGNRSALSNVPSATTTDTLSPAAVRNLAAGFVWASWRVPAGKAARGARGVRP